MNMIIHDLTKEEFYKLHHTDYSKEKVIGKTKPIQNCKGCFLCWCKTPGRCVLKDEYQKMGENIAASDEVTIISRLTYGGYSPFIKNILDRSISYILPFFTTRKGEVHHKARYKQRFKLHVIFYGNHISEEEKEIATKLVKRNALNFNCISQEATFIANKSEIARCLK
ncbi:iron-SULFUR flavoprotein [Lachnospiraceae bacterium KM106-2]|nr:iron-SULFUR flavoprotein [Lachnospiraceae bacterium KM106-2]